MYYSTLKPLNHPTPPCLPAPPILDCLIPLLWITSSPLLRQPSPIEDCLIPPLLRITTSILLHQYYPISDLCIPPPPLINSSPIL